jgi:23S rRNA (pseudouridine1915-N3)-methyltransferase
MRIHLISVGTRMPRWVTEGYADYAKRLPPECSLRLVEIPTGLRTKNSDVNRAIAEEGEKMLKALPAGAWVVALNVQGRTWSTEELATELSRRIASGRDLAMMVGGADGLAPSCLTRADANWSLSALTFPHALVRVIVAEQIYRAWSVLQHHPYHRID